MRVLYETVVTGDFIKSPDFICLDLINIDDINTNEIYHCFVSHQTRKKLEKHKINFSFSDHPETFTTAFLIAHFNDMTLTGDMILIPYGAIKNSLIEDSFFIRPNTGFKVFPGQVVDVDQLDLFEKTYKVAPDILCGRSSVVDIISEKRTFLNIRDKLIIDESLYSHDDIEIKDFDVRKAVNDLFERDSSYLLPDYVVADFALLKSGEIKLIEFNSIITSGHYNCNVLKLVESLEKE